MCLRCFFYIRNELRADYTKIMVEIIILAMIAAFLGLRLYSVLGERAEHEEEVVSKSFDPPSNSSSAGIRDSSSQRQNSSYQPQKKRDLSPAVERGLQDIAAAQSGFDVSAFLGGAKAAYQMVLEAFWQGDRETLKTLCDEDVYASFENAIDAREGAGQTLENKLIRIEEEKIHSAVLEGKIARIAVLFVSDIAAVTRDKGGDVIAGSLDDAVESRDIWTFSRRIDSKTPNWLLDETDAG